MGYSSNLANNNVKYEELEKLNFLSVSILARRREKLHTENNNAEARPKAEPERTLRVLFEVSSNFRVCSAQLRS